MNEDHIIAAILTAGLVAKNREDDFQPKDVVTLYEMCLSELLASGRTQRNID
ncbi:MAG: hypothetical protein MI673_03355 [Thiotrichales bacterium]|nr:hypothetical protein [Thiotrichales bacterium]